MDDICLLSTLTGEAAEVETSQELSTAVVTEAAHNLQTLFELTSLPTWQGEVARMLACMQHQQEAERQQQVEVTTLAHSGPPASSSDQEVVTATSPKTPSRAGPSSPSNEKPSTTAQPHVPAAAQPPHMAPATGYSSRICSALQLLIRGFPDAEEERVWQSDISVTSVRATDRLGMVLQAAISVTCMAHMWQEGLLAHWSLNWLLHTCYTAPWLWALLRCAA
jgi:hypothetical protein